MSLLERIENRTATIGIVGLGYVGLPLAVVFSEAGFRVKGIDVDAHKVAMLNRQESRFEDLAFQALRGTATRCSSPRPTRSTARVPACSADDQVVVVRLGFQDH